MIKLFTPLKIGSMEVKNRVFMAPMSSGSVGSNGMIDEKLEGYWMARAKGGVGCIVVDMVNVDPEVPYISNTLYFSGEESIASYKKFTDKIHSCGTKIIPQISHPGAESFSFLNGIMPVSASSYVNDMGQRVRELGIDELGAIVEKYAKTAYSAKQAGFDGIQLHCAHAYMLLSSFLSPLRNHRTDCYGGSLDNRARLLFEVVDAIKSECGKDFPIILRISGSEKNPSGLSLDDTLYLVPKLIEHGIDAFEVSGGSLYEASYEVIPCHHAEEGINLKEAKAIHDVSTVPVLLVGKVRDPKKAMMWVDNGYIDGVTMGRSMLADPELVRKAEEGRFDEIAPCTSCGVGCLRGISAGHAVTCVINPFVGQETTMELKKAAKSKKVAVIGGGIGGMACSRYLALRGHEVTLYEKSAKLGGQMNLACVAPNKQEMSKWIVYLNAELKRLGVTVRLNTTIRRDDASRLDADTVVVAVGSTPRIPPVPGMPKDAVTAHDVLSTKHIITDGNILFVGGGIVALETCEYLLAHKSALADMKITMIEMGEKIGDGMPKNNLVPTMLYLKAHGVKFMTNTKLLSVNGSSVNVEKDGAETVLGDFTDIVYSTGSVPNREFATCIEGKETYFIGDVNQVRMGLDAVREACDVALKI